MNLISTINQMERTMEYQAENTVSSFFYYMWNAWSEEECKTVYGGMYPHFWEKWCVATDKGTFGAAERFYLELSEDNRRILVERAVSIYDGRRFRKRNSNPKNQTVCEETLSVRSAAHAVAVKRKHGNTWTPKSGICANCRRQMI